MPPPPSFRPGDRLRVGGDAATVRYVGPVAGKGPDAWVGLEWDDEARGKHDGSVGGRRYFAVRSTAPASGSLIRAPALAAGAAKLAALLPRADAAAAAVAAAAAAAREGGGGGGNSIGNGGGGGFVVAVTAAAVEADVERARRAAGGASASDLRRLRELVAPPSSARDM